MRSDFKSQGIYLFSAFLTANGIDHVYINGKLKLSQQHKLLLAFNKGTEIQTKDGNSFVPMILLLDNDSSEGINLIATEHIHLLEPMLHQSQIDQVVARAVRYNSHVMLPQDRQCVYVHTYLGTLDTKHMLTKKQRYYIKLFLATALPVTTGYLLSRAFQAHNEYATIVKTAATASLKIPTYVMNMGNKNIRRNMVISLDNDFWENSCVVMSVNLINFSEFKSLPKAEKKATVFFLL